MRNGASGMGTAGHWLASPGAIETVLEQVQGEAETLDGDIRRELGESPTPLPAR